MRRRAAIEPVIGHLKAEHRMDRYLKKGFADDRASAVLAAAGYNGFRPHCCSGGGGLAPSSNSPSSHHLSRPNPPSRPKRLNPPRGRVLYGRLITATVNTVVFGFETSLNVGSDRTVYGSRPVRGSGYPQRSLSYIPGVVEHSCGVGVALRYFDTTSQSTASDVLHIAFYNLLHPPCRSALSRAPSRTR